MLQRLLIANRGEISCRISRTARKMGIETVAIYTPPDSNSNHTRIADIAVPMPSVTDYLNKDKIIEICKKYKVDAVHPGYGFLSENSQFAEMLKTNNVKWVGPPSEAIRQMGSKSIAKKIMIDAGVPVTPGYFGENQEPEHLLAEARKIEFPVLIKAVNGGGGKGMRIVHEEKDFFELLQNCQREAKNSFGNDKVLIEKYILAPRHIEVQVFADNHGNCVYLYERDCSVQRRHQKIIEEAPAPFITEELRKEIGDTACRAAKAIGYQGAGTVEFIFDTTSDNYYFMEMNVRLQVEHPVTEMITGLDLVEWQLNIAKNLPLPLKQEEIKRNGHAFQARIYAENPYNNFLPDSGQLTYYKEPTSARVDTYLSQKDVISVHYDPMISKLIVHDENRELALLKLYTQLQTYDVIGVHTNIPFLKSLCKDPKFKAFEDIDTNFIRDNPDVLKVPSKRHELLNAYIAIALLKIQKSAYFANVNRSYKWQFTSTAPLDTVVYTLDITKGDAITIKLTDGMDFKQEFKNCQLIQQNEEYYLQTHLNKTKMQIVLDDTHVIMNNGNIYKVEPVNNYELTATINKVNDIKAPMPSKIIKVMVKENDEVKIGQSLVVIEAMKMEHTVKCTMNGKVAKINSKAGDLVSDKKIIMTLE